MGTEHITEQEKWFFYRGKPLPTLYREYLQYLRQVKGITTGTIHSRKKPLLLFLMKMQNLSTPRGIKKLKARHIHDYVIETAQPLRREGKRCLTVALRDFFRFLHLNGYTATDLSKSVPTIIAYRLTTLHRGLSWKVVRKLLQVPDRRTHRGRRDFAILLMLARYGIRQGQLTELRLSDIDWKKAEIHFKAVKGGKDIRVPLFPDVAKALIAYFKGGRQDAPKKYDHVFLTTGTGGSLVYGQRPLASSLWGTVSRYLKEIGIDRACEFPRGPHAIRHAFATKLLEENQPIKTISDLLGHKSIQTTFVYTKSDIHRLRDLARKWPMKSDTKEAA